MKSDIAEELQRDKESKQTFKIHFDQSNITNEFDKIKAITPVQGLEGNNFPIIMAKSLTF